MIPKIIHQTWKNHDLPVPASMPESWKALNPDWEYRFWTDEQLADFVEEFYPKLWPLYQAADKPVMKADIARYLILHKFGGIYTDIDTTCLAPLSPLENEHRVVLSQEPIEHWAEHSGPRNMPYLVFNGTMVSPAGHPFWEHVMTTLLACEHAKYVLESTGPLMLTGALLSYKNQSEIALHSCHLFNLESGSGVASAAPEFGDYAPLRISMHHWQGSWFTLAKPNKLEWLKRAWAKLGYLLSRGAYLAPEEAKAQVDTERLNKALPGYNPSQLPTISILIPLRDAAPYLEQSFALLDALDYPKDLIKITFCEGESKDNTLALLHSLIAPRKACYRGIEVVEYSTGINIQRHRRTRPDVQKRRRSAIAKVRNHLISEGLNASDDFALWIDIDVCDYPANILHRLLSENARICTPDCTLEPAGRSFDLNAYLRLKDLKDSRYYKNSFGGIFQPPANHYHRRHLHDMRYLERVQLTAVGGTMLLVHAPVHLAGITFPELPYRDLIETEAFAVWAADMGVQAIGLPQVQIIHAPD